MSNCIYNVKAKVDAMRRRADREIARADKIRADAEAKHEEATQVMFDYVTQPRLPEFEKAKRAFDAGVPLDQVSDDLEAFRREHLMPLDALFFDRRDEVNRARILARSDEISAWYLEQKIQQVREQVPATAKKFRDRGPGTA